MEPVVQTIWPEMASLRKGKQMNEEVLALIKGSRRIDEMKKEIKSFVSMVLGAVDKWEVNKQEVHSLHYFKIDKIQWDFLLDGDSVKVNLWHAEQGFIVAFSNKSEKIDDIPLSHVKHIHLSLDDFWKETTNLFPSVRKNLVHLLEVGKDD